MEFLKTTSVAGASHASSGRIITVDADRVNPDAAPQSAPRAGLGLVELRDGRHTIVWADHGGGVPGTAAGQAAGRAAPTTARVVLCGCRQEGTPAPGGGGGAVLWGVAALGAGVVAGPGAATGPGHGRHDAGATLHRAGPQRGLSRLRHPGRVGGRARPGAGGGRRGVVRDANLD